MRFVEKRDISRLDTVIITAGYFATESLRKPSFEAQELMYRTCAIGPTILVTTLANKSDDFLGKDSKIIFVSSESGSISLRHEKEGGGNYGHHASKTALNMSAKLLSLDLKDRGVAVATVHPGFMRTEMTKGVGFDKFWDEGGAVTPDVAAESLAEWIETFNISKTGEYWAPRGPGLVEFLIVCIFKLTSTGTLVLPSRFLAPWRSSLLLCSCHGRLHLVNHSENTASSGADSRVQHSLAKTSLGPSWRVFGLP